MKQLQAGYFIESLKDIFSKKQADSELKSLTKHLSFFDYETSEQLENKSDNSTVFVINNLITRGLPTRPTVYVEGQLQQAFSKTEMQIDDNGNISFDFLNEELKDVIFRAFHVVNSSFKMPKIPQAKTEKEKFNNEIFYKEIPQKIGVFALQFIHKNRSYDTILQRNRFENKDNFVIEMPYSIHGKKGVIIETDADENEKNTDYLLIEEKKKTFAKHGFDFVFIKKGHTETGMQELQNCTYNSFFDHVRKNFEVPMHTRSVNAEALQLTLVPLAVARIQRIILEYILAQKLLLSAKEWNIAVIERDISAANIAVEDLQQLFMAQYAAQNLKKSFPKINLTVYGNSEFNKLKLAKTNLENRKNFKDFDAKKNYDLLIDISMLQHFGFDAEMPENKAKQSVKIRSAKFINSDRKFLTGQLIKYPDLSQKPDSKEAQNQNDALTYFLQNIFRKELFNDVQLPSVQKALSLNSFAHISSPASGKSLIYQFVSLMQPGLSVVTLPYSTLMKEQFKDLRNNYIDGNYYINSSLRKIKEKLAAHENFVNSRSLITFVSPSRLRSNSFKSELNRMKSAENYFAYFFIDEIQAVSEFSDDFNVAYSGITKIVRENCHPKSIKKLPVLAFSSNYNFEVIEDIKNELSVDTSEVLLYQPEINNINFKIIQTNKKEKTGKDIPDELRISANHKQVAITQLLKDINPEKTLIFCPNHAGEAGIMSDTGDSVSDKIHKSFPELDTAIFTGSIDAGRNSIGDDEAKISEHNFLDFKNNKTDILVATEELAIGSDKNDVENLVLFNFPQSIEKLYQISGRAGRNDKPANVYILYDNAIADVFELTGSARADGEIEEMEEILKINPDTIVRRKKIKKHFTGRQKESTIINELLKKITIPQIVPINMIENAVYKEFGEQVIVYTKPTKEPTQISVSQNNKAFGYIDYENNAEIVTKYSSHDKELSLDILEFVKNEISKLYGKETNFFGKIEKISRKKYYDGIETVLEKLKDGETGETEISFTNNILPETFEMLRYHVSDRFTKEIVKNAFENNSHHNDFIKELDKTFNTNVVTIDIDVQKELAKLFYKYRNKYDTENAIFRLMTIGVIDDYEINNSKECFIAKITKKKDLAYKTRLKTHVTRHLSNEFVSNFNINIDKYTGKTIIAKCVNYLLNYVYDVIRNEKYKETEIVNNFCKLLSDNEIDDIQIASFFEEYFTAKYANMLIEPSLIKDTNNFESSDFDTVIKFIRHAGHLKGNSVHLINSTDEALEANDSNFTLLLLNAYARFWNNYENKDNFDKAFSQLTKGFSQYETETNANFTESNDKKRIFLEKLYSQNPKMRQNIDPLVYLKSHTNWLEEFNAKFLNKKK